MCVRVPWTLSHQSHKKQRNNTSSSISSYYSLNAAGQADGNYVCLCVHTENFTVEEKQTDARVATLAGRHTCARSRPLACSFPTRYDWANESERAERTPWRYKATNERRMTRYIHMNIFSSVGAQRERVAFRFFIFVFFLCPKCNLKFVCAVANLQLMSHFCFIKQQ